MSGLSLERLKTLFDCDPDRGVLLWRNHPNRPKLNGTIAGCRNTAGYAVVRVDWKLRYVHRLIWQFVHGTEPVGEVDHINCDRFDNRISNLRQCSHTQNTANSRTPVTNTSGYRGVSYAKSNRKWRAQISINGVTKLIGYYRSAEEAYVVYCKAAVHLRGEFARLG